MTKNHLSEKVKRFRRKKGYSQEKLAEITGVSIRTIQRIENENASPSNDTSKRLADALELSPDDLLNWEPNENFKFLLILAASPILFILNPFTIEPIERGIIF